MPSYEDGVESQYQITPSQNNVAPSSYVSTLSHALNMSTPSSSRIQRDCNAAQSTPTRPVPAMSTSQHTTPTRMEALQTPTRTADATRLLTLSGHEAFQVPGTPASAWSVAPFTANTNASDDADSNKHREEPAHIHALPATKQQDQEWWMSGPGSSRTFNFLEAGSHPDLPAVGSAKAHTSKQVSDAKPSFVGNVSAVTTAGGRMPLFGTLSSPFHAYREQPGSVPRPSLYESIAVSEGPTSDSAFSPTRVAALSPVQPSSAFPVVLNDGTFLSAIFEQGTPSLCTHLLPNSDLTEHMVSRGELSATQRPYNNLSCVLVRPFQFASDSCQIGSEDQQSTHSASKNEATSSFQAAGVSANTSNPAFSADLSFASVQSASVVYHKQPLGVAFKDKANASSASKQIVAQPHVAEQSDMADTRDVTSYQSAYASHNVDSTEGNGLEGLGLNLNMAPIASQGPLERLSSLPDDRFMPTMLVDEMGRWMLDADAVQLTRSDHSSLSEGDSRGGRARWHGKDGSSASFSATTEGSFTSYSNSSTWDTSFNEMPSPVDVRPSGMGESQLVATRASSIGPSHGRDPHLAKSNHVTSAAVDPCQAVATPEVAMHDFSEFGQSISIEQMAEERWRTWPRNSVLRKDRSSSLALTMSPRTSLHSQGEQRTSLDSVSVSASSTRSRLLAEPYNKNMRSGRPSSSASTSSRSSIGNAASLDTQHSSGVTGPTRPRSYIATGSLRMSSAARGGPNGSSGSDSPQMANERSGGAALALRRARGMSHGGHPSSNNSSVMKLTRSTDGLMPVPLSSSSTKFRHSVTLQRTSTSLSSDGLAQTAQRPQSFLDTTAHPDSQRRLRKSQQKSKAKVGFGEVSMALDTLRMFLKQKEAGVNANNSRPHDDQGTPTSPLEGNEISSPGKPSRTLRRAKGVLPPRGAFSVDEFGTLQPTSCPKSSTANEAKDAEAGHGRSQSLGVGFLRFKQTSNPTSSSRQDDRLAVLEDLSERVRRLKAETERQEEQDAAQSMPPPSARPTGLHQRAQSSMTRREMHEEYLRKRGNGL